jgi:carbonyl reductase 1
LKAVQQIQEEGNANVHFYQLAVDNQQSIDRFANFIKQKHGGLDILFNNAGMSINVIL